MVYSGKLTRIKSINLLMQDAGVGDLQLFLKDKANTVWNDFTNFVHSGSGRFDSKRSVSIPKEILSSLALYMLCSLPGS